MRFSGTVGFAISTEMSPGVWQDVITERTYYGNVIRNASRSGAPSLVPPEIQPTIALENSFSVMGDANAYENYIHIRYVEWEGKRWEVKSVEVQRPRLILIVGGLWNGNTP